MNRRNFLKSAAVAAIGFPTIAMALKPIKEPERVRIVGNYVEILSVDELRSYGIRSSTYSATCVDKNGYFCHEKEYSGGEWKDRPFNRFEPFIRKTFVVRSLPQWWIGRYWHNEEESTMRHIKAMVDEFRNDAVWVKNNEVYCIADCIDEIKEKMEYVCFFAYCKVDPVPEEAWPGKWLPVVGGLSKHRYNLYLKQMNE